MKKYTFQDLKKGNYYFRENPADVLFFVGMRNDQIATFKKCEFKDESGDEIIITDQEIYITKNELNFY